MSGSISPGPADRPHRAAVLGSPVGHSLSPVLHRAAYAALGLHGWTYDRFEVDETALPGFLARLGEPGGPDGRDGPWAGLSLTMPLKRAVLPLLDTVSPAAATVESVNTVLWTETGLTGENTDIPGMVAALRESGLETVPHAAVLGAGATAASALAALAGGVCAGEVTAWVRGPERAAEMHGWGERLGVPVRTAGWDRAAEALTAPLVVATTPAGTTDALVDAVPDQPGTLFDVLYEPWPTPLAAAWERRGGRVVGGLDLLLHQAVLQVERMTGRTPAPLDAMRAAGRAALAARAT